MKWFFLPSLFFPLISVASVQNYQIEKETLQKKHENLQEKIKKIQNQLYGTLQFQSENKKQIVASKELVQLQRQELEVLREKRKNLESLLKDLTARRKSNEEQSLEQIKKLKRGVLALVLSQRGEKSSPTTKKTLSRWSSYLVKELEVLKIDQMEFDEIMLRMDEEKSNLYSLEEDLTRQITLIEWNQKVKKNHASTQSEQIQKQTQMVQQLQKNEKEMDQLLDQFSTRLELKKIEESERIASSSMRKGEILSRRGSLPWPLREATILQSFGPQLDAETKTKVFKKGIELHSETSEFVQSIAPGRVVYAGELDGYGKVIIVDHGSQIYSLYAKLGKILPDEGDAVTEQTLLGKRSESEPVYFEIRSKNVPLPPLQWLQSSISLKR